MTHKKATHYGLGLAVACTLTVLVSGCYELDTDIAVGPDGNVSVSHLHVVDPEVWSGDTEDASNYVLSLYDGYSQARYAELDGWVGYRFSGTSTQVTTNNKTSQLDITDLGARKKQITAIVHAERAEAGDYRGSSVTFDVADGWEIVARDNGGGTCLVERQRFSCSNMRFETWTPSITVEKEATRQLVEPEAEEPVLEVVPEEEPTIPEVEILSPPGSDDPETGTAAGEPDGFDGPVGGFDDGFSPDLSDEPTSDTSPSDNTTGSVGEIDLASLVPEEPEESGSGMWLGIIGGLVAAAAIGGVSFVLLRRKANREAHSESEEPATPEF